MPSALSKSLWSFSLRTVDHAKQRLKNSRVFCSLPFLHYTYLFDVSKAILVPELKLGFVPTPKVANRSMKAAIAVTVDPHFQGEPHHANWQYTPLPLLKDNDYFRFAFVRNPLDRLVSCYTQKIVLYGQQYNMPIEFWRYGNRFSKEMSFEQFVQAVSKIPDAYSDIHFRSQHTFLYHKNQCMVDFVGHFETLKEDWTQLSERVGFPALPHYNRSAHSDYRDMFTPELARLAYTRYHRDIELFGYEEEINALLE